MDEWLWGRLRIRIVEKEAAANLLNCIGMKCWSECPLPVMVGAEGFEPPTLCSQSRCATRLRYAPKPIFDCNLNRKFLGYVSKLPSMLQSIMRMAAIVQRQNA